MRLPRAMIGILSQDHHPHGIKWEDLQGMEDIFLMGINNLPPAQFLHFRQQSQMIALLQQGDLFDPGIQMILIFCFHRHKIIGRR